jgi:hypothetical protein
MENFKNRVHSNVWGAMLCTMSHERFNVMPNTKTIVKN